MRVLQAAPTTLPTVSPTLSDWYLAPTRLSNHLCAAIPESAAASNAVRSLPRSSLPKFPLELASVL